MYNTPNFTPVGICVIERPLDLMKSLETRILEVEYPGNWNTQQCTFVVNTQQYLFNECRSWWNSTWRVRQVNIAPWPENSVGLPSEFQTVCIPRTVVGFGKRYSSVHHANMLGFLCFSKFSTDHGDYSVNLFAWNNLPKFPKEATAASFWFISTTCFLYVLSPDGKVA